MATIKFDLQDELNELIARIYLDTHKKYTKKELLSLIFELGSRDYHLLLDYLTASKQEEDTDLRERFINTFSAALSLSDTEEITPKSIWEKPLED
ncbi:MAG: hypothetical protein ACTSWW_04860 [Promethearchaeota archaeon]